MNIMIMIIIINGKKVFRVAVIYRNEEKQDGALHCNWNERSELFFYMVDWPKEYFFLFINNDTIRIVHKNKHVYDRKLSVHISQINN